MTYSRFNKRRAARGVIFTRGSEGNAERYWRKMFECQRRKWRVCVYDNNPNWRHRDIVGGRRGLSKRFNYWERASEKLSLRSGQLRRRFTYTIHDCPF